MRCIGALWSEHFGCWVACALERACWCSCRVQLQQADSRCCCQSGLCALLVPLQGAAWRCCLRVLLLEGSARFGAGMLVLLQGAAAGCCLRAFVRMICALWSGHVAAAGRNAVAAVRAVCALCRVPVLLELAAVRTVCMLWSGHVVPLQEGRLRFGAWLIWNVAHEVPVLSEVFAGIIFCQCCSHDFVPIASQGCQQIFSLSFACFHVYACVFGVSGGCIERMPSKKRFGCRTVRL